MKQDGDYDGLIRTVDQTVGSGAHLSGSYCHLVLKHWKSENAFTYKTHTLLDLTTLV